MIRRKFEDEISKVDGQSSVFEIDKSDANVEIGMGPTWLRTNQETNPEQRPVSALLMRPQRQNLIQFALPENVNMRAKGSAAHFKELTYDNSNQRVIQRHFGHEYSDKELRTVASSAYKEIKTNQCRLKAYSQAKQLVESAVVEVQNDMDYKRAKDGILQQMFSDCAHEIHAKAETTIKEKQEGSLNQAAEHRQMQVRMMTAFQNIVKASDLDDTTKIELTGGP